MFFFKASGVFPCGMKAQWWRKNTAGRLYRRWGGHAAVDQVPVCWNLDFNWNPLTLFTLKFDLPKIRLAPCLPERKYCVGRGMAVFYIGILNGTSATPRP